MREVRPRHLFDILTAYTHSKATPMKLQSLIEKDVVTAPGVFDGLSALLAVQTGFTTLYASGGAIARASGLPDIGLLSLTEVLQRVKEIVEATQGRVPVIADADTGFGNELNVARTVRAFEQVGVAALHLEDQTFPKRCGHLAGKTLIETQAMCRKIKAACQSRVSQDFMVIARTDAIAVEGFEAALARGHAYVKAGADMLFVEAPTSEEQIAQIAAAFPNTPKLINMFAGGKTPLVPREKLKALGYAVMIVPSDLQRAAITAMQQTLQAIQQDGHSQSRADHLTTFNERESIIGTQQYFEFAKALEEG